MDGNPPPDPLLKPPWRDPMAKRVHDLRKAMLEAVTPADIQCVTRRLVDAAKLGNVYASRELILHTQGRPLEQDILERLEAIEKRLHVGEETP